MKTLSLGDRGTWVFYLQLALRRAGQEVSLDGKFGEETCLALGSFLEQSQGECRVDISVWEKLIPYLKGYTEYTVKPGDTFWRIGDRFGTSAVSLQIANPNLRGRFLPVGEVVKVPYDFPLVPTQVPYSSQLAEWLVEGLHTRYPFIRYEQAGQSVLGRPLWVLRMGQGRKQVFYNASFHANEWINTPLLFRFLEEYGESLVSGKSLYGHSARFLFAEYELFCMPLVNPDGVDLVSGTLDSGEAFQAAEEIAADYPEIPFPNGWKANIEGIDLNLQFPAGWENAKEIKFAAGFTTPAPRDYVGAVPLEAPESRAVYDYTREHNFRLILAYHTQGEVIYWKYLDYEPYRSREIARYFGEVSGYAVEETPSQSGYAGYKDWFIQNYDRPGYTIETGTGVSPLPLNQVPPIYQDNIQILIGGMTQI